MVQNSQFFYGLIWSNIVQNGIKWFLKKSLNWSKCFPKWSYMVQIHQKLFHKMTAVGVTAVGVQQLKATLNSKRPYTLNLPSFSDDPF